MLHAAVNDVASILRQFLSYSYEVFIVGTHNKKKIQ